MSGHGGWRVSEIVLLLAVIAFAILAAVRLVTRDAGRGSAALIAPAPAAVAPLPRSVPADPPPSPDGAELLARIRSCSPRELAGIVDGLSGAEAVGLYRGLTASDRQAVLAAMPSPILARKAHELLGVPESCFRRADRPGLLASSLLDAAMGAPGAAADPQRVGLSFAGAIDEQGIPQGLRRSFRPAERTIYACLDAGSEPAVEPGVLVRWTVEGSDDLVYLHYLPLSPNQRWNHVSFTVAEAWPAATYRVRFYRLGETAGLLAEGTYIVRDGG